jgi:hypothetical protein
MASTTAVVGGDPLRVSVVPEEVLLELPCDEFDVVFEDELLVDEELPVWEELLVDEEVCAALVCAGTSLVPSLHPAKTMPTAARTAAIDILFNPFTIIEHLEN